MIDIDRYRYIRRKVGRRVCTNNKGDNEEQRGFKDKGRRTLTLQLERQR